VIAALGGQCRHCGFADSRALQIDHVEGGGGKERRSAPSQIVWLRAVLQSVVAGEHRYQLLCANCNWIKRVEQEEWRGGS
jgi:hypothetical protein